MTQRTIVAVLTLAALVACERRSAAVPGARDVEHVDAQRFLALAPDRQGLYVDVRTPGEFARGHLAGAVNIDISSRDFEARVSRISRKQAILVYCASGARSRAAADQLQDLGFQEIYELKGGIGSWMRAGLPVEQTAGAERGDPALAFTPEKLDALLAKEKRVLVDYHTAWCPPCRRMSPIVDGLTTAWAGRATVARVDIEQSRALADREHVEGLPTFVLYLDGREKWRREGELSKDVLEAALTGP